METLIEILIDYSNSMGDMYGTKHSGKYLLPDGSTRMSLLKKVMLDHIIPTIDYSSKVKAQKFYSNGNEDAAKLDPIFNGAFDKQALINAIKTIPDNPRNTGGTPITGAIVSAINSLSKHKDADRKIILLTDGEETGTGNYQSAAKQALGMQGIPCKIFIIGIAQNSEAERKCSDLAKHTKGQYVNIPTSKYSTTALQVALEPLKTKVLQDSIRNIQATIDVQPTSQPKPQPDKVEQPQIIQTLNDKLETVKTQTKQANTIIQVEALGNKIKEHISSSQKLLSELSELKDALRIEALLSSGIDATTLTIDNDYSENIRKKSEAFLYNLLCDKYGKEKVKWLNQNFESGSQHDFEISDNNQNTTLLIECKGTAANKPTFYLTANEWKHFLKNKSIYQVYRIFNVDSNMNAICIDNLHSALLSGQVVPYLLKPEILKEERVFLTLLLP